MTHPIGPDGRPQEAVHLTARGADGPRPAVSILSDLSPGRVRLAPAAATRPGRWKWALPPVLVALVGGGFLLGRQAPGPTPALPATAVAAPRSAPPLADEPLALPAAPAGGGAIIREASAPAPGPGAPEATAGLRSSVVAPPPRTAPRPQPASPRPAAAPQPRPAAGPDSPRTAPVARQAATPPGQAVERDVDIITAIVK